MNVIPFPAQGRFGLESAALGRTTAAATGSFPSPRGGRGTFAGTYRIGSVVSFGAQLAVTGVVSGALRGADGAHIGVASRRCTGVVRVVEDLSGPQLVVGPLETDLLGFVVSIDAFGVELPSRP